MNQNSTDRFAKRLHDWLNKVGFESDPFALYEADHESKYLHYFFVDRPYLHDILGDPAQPQTAFLIAKRGEGKTATREMVAHECMHGKMGHRALAVNYHDFGLLLREVKNDLSKINVYHHTRGILRAILKALAEQISVDDVQNLTKLNQAWLKGYAEVFADPFSRSKFQDILVIQEPVIPSLDEFSAQEVLSILAQLITNLGQAQRNYQSLYILIDCVDETSLGKQAAIPLLKPLVSDLSLLETPHLAFKFFIPHEVGELLRKVVKLRPDRLCIRTIQWHKGGLENVVQQRLTYYSNGAITRLEEICTPSAKPRIMERLIDACNESPRTLLRLCRALIHHHVASIGELLISNKDVIETLSGFTLKLRKEEASLSISTVNASSSTPSNTNTKKIPEDRSLYLESSGHVWVDGEQLIPPLSQQEFILLNVLYQNAPGIVSHETLINSIWPMSDWGPNEVYTEQNLRKLISRLRERLEPNVSGRHSRFIKTAPRRGYWIKID